VTGIHASHNVEVHPLIGGRQTLLDGVSGSFNQDEWLTLDYQLPLKMHLQAVTLRWLGCKLGDYGFLVVLHPSGNTSPTEAMAEGDTTLEVPAEVAPVYAAAMAVEFWNADESVLVERRRIASVDGTTVTLATGVSNPHTTAAKVKAVVGAYSPCTGEDNCDSGMRLLGDSFGEIHSENEFTSPLDAGLLVGCRFKGSAVAGDRSVAVNFRFRLYTEDE